MKKIILCCLVIVSMNTYADTCKPTNESLPFRQVVLDKVSGGGRCDYGDGYDFKHGYNIEGLYKPVSGPWHGSSAPMIIACSAYDSTQCVFELSN